MDKEAEKEFKNILARDPYLRGRVKIGLYDSRKHGYRDIEDKDVQYLKAIQKYTNEYMILKNRMEEVKTNKEAFDRKIKEVNDLYIGSLEKEKNIQQDLDDIDVNFPEIIDEDMEIF